MTRASKQAAGGSAGTGGSILIVWLLGYAGVDISAEIGAAIGAASAAAGAFLWHHGIVGAFRQIVHGDGSPSAG